MTSFLYAFHFNTKKTRIQLLSILFYSVEPDYIRTYEQENPVNKELDQSTTVMCIYFVYIKITFNEDFLSYRVSVNRLCYVPIYSLRKYI
jgi:hypothetical protein